MALTKVQEKILKLCNSPRTSSQVISQFSARRVNVLEELDELVRQGYMDNIGGSFITNPEYEEMIPVVRVEAKRDRKCSSCKGDMETCICDDSCVNKQAKDQYEPCSTCGGKGTYGDGETCPDCDGLGVEAGWEMSQKQADDEEEEEDEKELDIEEEIEDNEEEPESEDDEVDELDFVSDLIEALFAGETDLPKSHKTIHNEFGEEEGEEVFETYLEMLQEELEVRNIVGQEATRQLTDTGEELDLNLEEYEKPTMGASKVKSTINNDEIIQCEACGGQGFMILEIEGEPAEQQEPCQQCGGSGQFVEFPKPKAKKKSNKKKVAKMEIEKFEDYDLDDYDTKKAYDDFLDEIYGDIEIGNSSFRPSQILEELEPTTYRVGFGDWVDSEMDSNPKWICPICEELFDSEGEAEEHMEEEGIDIASDMIPTGATKGEIIDATGLDEDLVDEMIQDYHDEESEDEAVDKEVDEMFQKYEDDAKVEEEESEAEPTEDK